MKRLSFIELAQFLITVSNKFPNEQLFEDGRATKPKQLANYLKQGIDSIGRSPICHIRMTSLKERKKLEKLLTSNQVMFNPDYIKSEPVLEVYMNYFKWFNLGN